MNFIWNILYTFKCILIITSLGHSLILKYWGILKHLKMGDAALLSMNEWKIEWNIKRAELLDNHALISIILKNPKIIYLCTKWLLTIDMPIEWVPTILASQIIPTILDSKPNKSQLKSKCKTNKKEISKPLQTQTNSESIRVR